MPAGRAVGSPWRSPGGRRKERELRRALRREQTSRRRTHGHCGRRARREDGREEEKERSAPHLALQETRGGGPGRQGDSRVLQGGTPGLTGSRGRGQWPKEWNKGPCAGDGWDQAVGCESECAFV